MALLFEDLSYQINGALFDVYRLIGFGHKEVVYQKAVAECLKGRGLQFKEQVKADIIINGTCIGKYFLDFLVEGSVVLELKSRSHFQSADYRQVKAYLETTGLKLGILAAFTQTGVRLRRVLNEY